MKMIHGTIKEMVNDLLIIMFAFGTCGISLKYTTFFDQWVYFPLFPNICDSIFLIAGSLYLSLRVKLKESK